MHVYMVLLPAIVSHGIHHVYGSLTKLFEGWVFILCDAGFVMCYNRRNEGVGPILAQYYG